jgi:hypothetical protein
MIAIRTFNIEAGLATLDEAWRLVIAEIKPAKRAGARVLKLIHWYGWAGNHGALCIGLCKSYGLRIEKGVIEDFIEGENFSIFNDTVLTLLEAVPEIRGGPDLSRASPISI